MPRTRTIRVDADEPDPTAIAEAAEILKRGGLVAFATETVYGLGADATNPEAVARIFEAKGRPSFNPLIVHGDRPEMVRACVSEWPEIATVLKRRFWPGPLTMVLPRSAIIPDIVTAGRDTVGIRVPNVNVARVLIQFAGTPIAAPSANRSTGVSPTEALHVLKDLDGKIDLVLDSGWTGIGLESTVVDLTTAPPRVLRPGTITAESLSETLGVKVAGAEAHAAESGPIASPGQMAIHYSPHTPTYRIERQQLKGIALPDHSVLISIGPPPDITPRGTMRHVRLRSPAGAARKFYRLLHGLDAMGVEAIVIVPPPDLPQWHAIRDRIWRAARPWNEPLSGA